MPACGSDKEDVHFEFGNQKQINIMSFGVHMQLIHFDIKPANILLDHAWTQAKISDVGETCGHNCIRVYLMSAHLVC